jgi:hypothetical protein
MHGLWQDTVNFSVCVMTSPYVVAEIFIFAGHLTDGCNLHWCNSASRYPLLTEVYTCHLSRKGHKEGLEIEVTIQLRTVVSGEWCVERRHRPFRLG